MGQTPSRDAQYADLYSSFISSEQSKIALIKKPVKIINPISNDLDIMRPL